MLDKRAFTHFDRHISLTHDHHLQATSLQIMLCDECMAGDDGCVPVKYACVNVLFSEKG